MADSHDQIWLQIATASAQNESLFRGKGTELEQQILRVLKLQGAPKFPLFRLMTI
jgi:hypothetical protein